MYIFLDIDGVLVTKDNPSEVLQFDPSCLKRFEQVIERHEHSTIIIASAWREVYSLEIIKSLFSKTVAAKILGMTPIISYPIECFRYQEILAYRQHHQLFTQPWIALDDKAEYYPTEAPVIITHAASSPDGTQWNLGMTCPGLCYTSSRLRSLPFQWIDGYWLRSKTLIRQKK